MLNSALPLGAAIGSFFASFLLKKMGLRTIFILSDIVTILVS